MEINELENKTKKIEGKIHKGKHWFLKQINKSDKTSSQMYQEKREKTQITNVNNGEVAS